MKILLIIFLITLLQVGYSQNILGLYVDIDGKVKFWMSETNLNGHLEDTVIIKCGSATTFEDLRNLRQINLTFIEPEESPHSYGDPSNMNDTAQYKVIDDWSTINYQIYSPDSLLYIVENIDLSDLIKRPFYDETRGDGLSDSIVKILKTKLTNHVNQFYGKGYPQKERNKLYEELSVEDTVINKQGIYDYIVDELIFYSYADENLTSKIWYHWDHGIEVDSFEYDKKGNLIYFSREYIGGYRDELFFKYNHSGQVIFLERRTRSVESDPLPYNSYSLESVKFSYNDTGIMNSKSQLGPDDRWYICYYEIKKYVTTKPKRQKNAR